MEREEWNGSAPDFHAVQDSETSRHDRILEATEADREARAVQAMAREMAETGPAEEPTAESYEAAARRLEHLTESEPDLANNIISARLADIELRDKFGSDRFDLFKQAQTEGLDRIGEDYRIHYRSMLQARNETPDERYQRLRTDLARLMRELYERSRWMTAQKKPAQEIGTFSRKLLERSSLGCLPSSNSSLLPKRRRFTHRNDGLALSSMLPQAKAPRVMDAEGYTRIVG